MMLIVALPLVSADAANITPTNLTVQLYADGVVDICYVLEVDPTLARVNVTLFGTTRENLIVTDQDGFILDHMARGDHITIDVLGSTSVEIFYSTSDLTNKLSSLWSLNLLAPINVDIRLPTRATIISLSSTPINIRIAEDVASLTMPAGAVEISYMLDVTGVRDQGARDQALALKKEAEAAVEEAKAEGIRVDDTELLLQQADYAYEEERYDQVEQYANQAKALVAEMRSQAQEAINALKNARSAIKTAEEEKRISSLEDAMRELETANNAYEAGDYEVARYIAQQASITAQLSKPALWLQNLPLLGLLGTAMAAPVIIVYRFMRRRQAPLGVGPEPEKLREPEEVITGVDLNSLFGQHQFLRTDDKEVIRYISECGGGAFMSELRKRFDLPKSSAWRMIRRLEREEIVETRAVGRETFVQISPRYVLMATEGAESSFQIVPAGSYYQGSAAD
jgi:uncharacterized membrane protein